MALLWILLGLLPAGSGMDEVSADGFSLKIRTYRSATIEDEPVLVVALHGDAPFGKPGYHYRFAELIAQRGENVVAVGLLRPGYTDPDDRRSDGERGRTVGDNYDNDRVARIAAGIARLKQQHRARRVILAGHSGGAAISAKIIALHPGLIDHAFLVACPCNINQWRRDMAALTGEKVFEGDIEVVSPHQLVDRIPGQTRISMFVGRDDKVTKPALTKAFTTALKERGHAPEMQVITGDHEIFLNGRVLGAVVKAVAADP